MQQAKPIQLLTRGEELYVLLSDGRILTQWGDNEWRELDGPWNDYPQKCRCGRDLMHGQNTQTTVEEVPRPTPEIRCSCGRELYQGHICKGCGKLDVQCKCTSLLAYKVNPVRCCDRDNDGDGNCDIHSAPGVMRHNTEKQTPEHWKCLVCGMPAHSGACQ